MCTYAGTDTDCPCDREPHIEADYCPVCFPDRDARTYLNYVSVTGGDAYGWVQPDPDAD